MEDYAYMRALNRFLLDIYNNKEYELTFYDYYLFHATSMWLSVVRESQCLDYGSFCLVLSTRSLIEDLAVLKMYDSGAITSDCKELLRGHQYLCEYKTYQKCKDLDGILFDLEEMKKNYSDVKEYYKEIIELNSKEFDNLLSKNNLAFLKEKNSFHNLIDMYCPNYLKEYEQMSYIIHPSNYYDNLGLVDKFKYEDILTDILNESKKYYPKVIVLNMDYFAFEKGTYFHSFDELSMKSFFDEFNKTIREDLELTDDVTLEKKVFFLGDLLKDEMSSIMIEFSFGFSEVLKSKLKTVFEIFAFVCYILDCLANKERRFVLPMIEIYNNMHIQKEFYGKDYKKMIEEFNIKNNTNMLSPEKMAKNVDQSLPEFLDYNSIKDFVFDMIEDLLADKKDNKSVAKMLYLESQLLSHGNGYMLPSNFGCFSDADGAFAMIDLLFEKLFDKMGRVLEILSNEDNKWSKASCSVNGKLKEKFKEAKRIKYTTYSFMKLNTEKIG